MTKVLTNEQREILHGLILGDLHMETQTKGKTFRLKFCQSNKLHKEYLFHLYDIYRDFVGTPPKYKEDKN